MFTDLSCGGVSVVINTKAKNLEWREFLESSRENLGNKQSDVIKAEFLNAESLINCMSYYYELQTVIPQINVDSLLGSKINSSLLYYDPKDMTINISSILILEYFKDKNLIELEQTRNEFLWGIAHEFFHHGRNHIAVWNHYGIKQTDICPEHYHWLRFLEDDVDRLATTALYRHFLNTLYKGSDSYNVKLKVLTALFKPIYSKIQESKNRVTKTHPAWITRLYSQIIKLSELDNINNNPQNPNERITVKTIVQQNLLTDELVEMIKEYSHDTDLIDYLRKPVDFLKDDASLNKAVSDYPNFPVTQRFLDLYYLNITDNKIGDFLRENCNLPGLKDPKRQWQPIFAAHV